jgi:hypothetical protein
LSIVSAYFTIHAYEALREVLENASNLRFLFGEPRFVRSLDRENKQSRQYRLTEQGLSLANQLAQRRLARDCADWIRRKVEVRSVTRSGFLHGKLYHIQDGNRAHALVGSSNFTVPGLGLLNSGNNIELNLVVTDDRDRADLLVWFDSLWNDAGLVEDVRDIVLKELARLYANQPPQFIYYLTLFHLFRDFLDGTHDLEETLRRTALPDTRIWRTLFSFQQDGAKAAINKILASTAAYWPTASGWARPLPPWRSSNTSSCATSASWCCAPRNCAGTGPSTAPTARSTPSSKTAFATTCCRIPTCRGKGATWTASIWPR